MDQMVGFSLARSAARQLVASDLRTAVAASPRSKSCTAEQMPRKTRRSTCCRTHFPSTFPTPGTVTCLPRPPWLRRRQFSGPACSVPACVQRCKTWILSLPRRAPDFPHRPQSPLGENRVKASVFMPITPRSGSRGAARGSAPSAVVRDAAAPKRTFLPDRALGVPGLGRRRAAGASGAHARGSHAPRRLASPGVGGGEGEAPRPLRAGHGLRPPGPPRLLPPPHLLPRAARPARPRPPRRPQVQRRRPASRCVGMISLARSAPGGGGAGADPTSG